MLVFLLAPLLQAAMTPDQTFVIEVLKLLIPVITGALSIAAAYLAYLKSREVKHEVADLVEKHDELTKNVDGKMARLLEQTERAAHAEGVVEGVKSGIAPPILPVVVAAVPPRDPQARTRAADQVPPESDPSTHLR